MIPWSKTLFDIILEVNFFAAIVRILKNFGRIK